MKKQIISKKIYGHTVISTLGKNKEIKGEKYLERFAGRRLEQVPKIRPADDPWSSVFYAARTPVATANA